MKVKEIKEMSSSGLEQNVVSESPKMRSGRLVYGLYHGIKTYQLVFTKIIKDTLDYSRLVDEVNYYFLRDEPYYLYRDFRKKADRVDLPKKRAKVFTKSIDHQKNGLKVEFTAKLESYELPYEEDTEVQRVTWTATHSWHNKGGHRLDPRYCPMKMTITVSGSGAELKVLFNGQPYFWYKKSVKQGDIFIIDGTDVEKNRYNCFEDCHKQTSFLKTGNNRIDIQGASCEALFEYRLLYL
ncbi:phage tail family protein [Streptococcus equi subsp. equi]|uniref:phage tail domain-containing protein n=1 Tax=Streptococcus equi TaxID=1336 RepID=UPI001E351FF7|nr:phage tail domain-containing protein [Streptococcus equi]MCD3566815.1 phage tail family protein [Streptococcus equi subsp. equi]